MNDAELPKPNPHSGNGPGAVNVCIRYTLLIVWMVVIWLFSAQANSAEHTREIFHEGNFLVRKLAHFTEYAILAILAYIAFSAHVEPAPAVLRSLAKNAATAAVVLSALFASSDEIHQAFVPGRSAAIRDVLIDSSGAAVAMLVLSRFRNKRKEQMPETNISGTCNN